MRRICRYCGASYDGDPGSSCCPACAAAQRKTSLRPRVCTVCGASFSGGPAARYCPSCRAERRKEADRRRRLGPSRPLGSEDRCIVCGNPYVVTGGRQCYCPACAPEAVRAKDRASSRAWNQAHTTPAERQKIRRAASAAIPCVICGALFVPHDASTTCSAACSEALRRKNAASWESEHIAQRNAYHKELRRQKEAAMSTEEYAAYHAQQLARARENYRKRKQRSSDDAV